jgi:1-deoxy-D-xylulose-5-phosphate reductoisomerase
LNKYEIFNDTKNFHKLISKKTDVIIFAISGLSSFDLFLKILKSGKKIGIANKECIISFGKKIITVSKKYNTEIIPLDSEHNSIYQLLKYNFGKYKSLTITATGGPFINFNKQQLNNVTLKQAIKHPVWNMGKKISIDSATMMNKAFEMIEAKFLFNLKDHEINSIIHPQAIVHALVNYENGVSTAILNRPDMKIPISSLFFKFNHSLSNQLNSVFDGDTKLEFFQIDEKRFPAIRIGYNVMKQGGLMPHVFNYLNEILVNLFIKGKIRFTDIVSLNEINIEKVFNKNSNISNPKYNDIKDINNWIDHHLIINK